ncbi:DNA gyrase inhibitor YacG [Sphingomonas sp. DT-207]|uniref:DNA gyrase inhibitor YacG n=1 Tax=Sphingomonas sp. DT-207 TaxID=3396167 RepID=UPI003F1CA623
MAKRDGCPVCGKPTDQEFKPFCSRGCKDRDLLQWLGEGYRIPGERVDPNAQTGLDRDRDRD